MTSEHDIGAIWAFHETVADAPDREIRLLQEAGQVPGQQEVEALFRLAADADGRFLPAVLAVLEAGPDDPSAWAWLGAGPLDDYVDVASPSQLHALRSAARRAPRLARALAAVPAWPERG